MRKITRFTAKWCGPCRSYASVWNCVVADHASSGWEWHVIDIDADPAAADKHGITSIPATVVEIDGVEVDRKIGSLTQGQLRQLLVEHALRETTTP